MQSRCANCDRPDCEEREARQAIQVLAETTDFHLTDPKWHAINEEYDRAAENCYQHSVHWRYRALLAEAQAEQLHKALVHFVEVLEEDYPYHPLVKHGHEFLSRLAYD